MAAGRWLEPYLGADKVVFASDFLFDAEGGSYPVRETIEALHALELTSATRRQIDIGNVSEFIRRNWEFGRDGRNWPREA